STTSVTKRADNLSVLFVFVARVFCVWEGHGVDARCHSFPLRQNVLSRGTIPKRKDRGNNEKNTSQGIPAGTLDRCFELDGSSATFAEQAARDCAGHPVANRPG